MSLSIPASLIFLRRMISLYNHLYFYFDQRASEILFFVFCFSVDLPLWNQHFPESRILAVPRVNPPVTI